MVVEEASMSRLLLVMRRGSVFQAAASIGLVRSISEGGGCSSEMKLKSPMTPVSTHRWVNCAIYCYIPIKNIRKRGNKGFTLSRTISSIQGVAEGTGVEWKKFHRSRGIVKTVRSNTRTA
jgi:hypothetical protein